MGQEILQYRLRSTEKPRLSSRELVQIEHKPSGKVGEVSVVIPEVYGKYMAGIVRDSVHTAQQTNKIAVLDLPTGNTPKPMWPHLKEMVLNGELDLSHHVVFVGHEAAFGTPEPQGPVDYESYRRQVLQDLGVALTDITVPQDVKGETIQGNFLPMYLVSGENTQDSARQSAQKYGEILHALKERQDTILVGMYGVGKDGHIGEIQPNTLTGAVSYDTREVFSYPITDNSWVSGAFPWRADKRREFNNNMYAPSATMENPTHATPNYHGGEYLIGPGWNELLLHDSLTVAFDSTSKQLAFQLALQGSVDALVMDDKGRRVMKLKKTTGEGEGRSMYRDLKTFAQRLEKNGFLTAGVVDEVQHSKNPTKCKMLFQQVYDTLRQRGAQVDDPLYAPIYQKMWDFANRYVGKEAPVAVLIRLRTLLGLDTTIVATPEVVKGTQYEKLLK